MADILVEDLVKEFKSAGGHITAVNGINLKIEDGEFFTIVGPSGCGKTTTLRCIAGLETPTSGTILFGNSDVTHVPTNKRNIAMMFQNIALYPHMTVRDNIAYPLKLHDAPKDVQKQKTEEAAEIMQIGELLEKHPGQLSGGQQQRAALARTLVQDPQVFLMDEPLSDLDAKLKVEMRKEIQRVHKQVNKPTVYVTHDQEEAMTMSDRIAVMNDGNIMQVGTPDELYESPRNLFVAQFIGNPEINVMECDVVDASSDRWTVTYDDLTMEIRVNDPSVTPGESITLGIRPEQIRINEDGDGLTREVRIIERISDRMLITTMGQDEFRVLTPPRNDIEEGDKIHLSFDQKDVFLFDEDGELISRGDEQQSVEPL